VAGTVFYIQKGRVKLTVLSEQGKEALVGILEPGQFFGEGCLNGHSLRIATTTAMEECVITSITKEAMIYPACRAEIFRAVHGVSLDTEQPN
jgi:CRP/FNR family cyclic AMP-dependent transcriptional regulator